MERQQYNPVTTYRKDYCLFRFGIKHLDAMPDFHSIEELNHLLKYSSKKNLPTLEEVELCFHKISRHFLDDCKNATLYQCISWIPSKAPTDTILMTFVYTKITPQVKACLWLQYVVRLSGTTTWESWSLWIPNAFDNDICIKATIVLLILVQTM